MKKRTSLATFSLVTFLAAAAAHAADPIESTTPADATPPLGARDDPTRPEDATPKAGQHYLDPRNIDPRNDDPRATARDPDVSPRGAGVAGRAGPPGVSPGVINGNVGDPNPTSRSRIPGSDATIPGSAITR